MPDPTLVKKCHQVGQAVADFHQPVYELAQNKNVRLTDALLVSCNRLIHNHIKSGFQMPKFYKHC